MSGANQTNYPDWTDEQWARVTKVVSQEAQKARVAAQFLPLYGPVDASVVAVPNLRLGNAPNPAFAQLRAPNRLRVDSTPGTFLATLSVQVPLATHDVADPELQAALVAFRAAAVILAKVEDALIFNGQPAADTAPVPTFTGGWLQALPPVFTVTGGAQQAGLVPRLARPDTGLLANAVTPRVSQQTMEPAGYPWPAAAYAANMGNWGHDIVRSISAAIGALEGNGHSGPFACYLSPNAFEAVHTPAAASMVMPRDRIIPFLGGEYLLRTQAIPGGFGIIVALGAGPVEIVVASDISVRYLQQTPEPRFLFRISERLALRVKQWDAIAVLQP